MLSPMQIFRRKISSLEVLNFHLSTYLKWGEKKGYPAFFNVFMLKSKKVLGRFHARAKEQIKKK